MKRGTRVLLETMEKGKVFWSFAAIAVELEAGFPGKKTKRMPAELWLTCYRKIKE